MLMGLLKKSEDDYRNEIIRFNNWCVENYLDLNVGKTKKMVFDFKKVETNIVLIILKNGSVEIVNKYKYLGIYIDNWCVENYLDLNVGKTKKMVFDFKKVETNIVLIILKNGSVEIVNKYKYLGIYIDNRLNFSVNIENLFKRSTIRLQHL